MLLEHAVSIRINDKKATFIAKLKAKLKKAQAEEIANQLNAVFASTGTRWFAIIERIED